MDASDAQQAGTLVSEQQLQQPQPSQPSQQYIAKSVPLDQIEKTKMQRFKEFLTECRRVLRITKKPDKEEFKTIVKISGIGIIIIGALGFLVSFIKEVLF